MNFSFLTLSSFLVILAVSVFWGWRSQVSDVSVASSVEPNVEDSVILSDAPPPDDTYTPDQRTFS